MKIVYCTPSLYIAGGIERVLTTKMNYLSDKAGYEVWVILTDGKGKNPYFPLSDKIHIVNLDLNFEELWSLGFLKKIFVYLKKQRIYKKKLKEALYEIRPDITVSTLRREINFITSIKDGSRKVGEMHVNRTNYRNFKANETNALKKIFERIWMKSLVGKLKKLDKFVVLTEEDRHNWTELDNVITIPNPLNVFPDKLSCLSNKKVVAAGRYCHEKGFDLLIEAWAIVSQKYPDWHLEIYGAGNKDEYIKLADKLMTSQSISFNSATDNIYKVFADASIFAFSSRFEGFGMALLEALATKLPAVSFACPCGPRNILSDGKDGFLVENGNIQKFAEKICYLISHDIERKRMGENAILKAEQYRLDGIMQKWIRLFESL